MVKDLIHMDTYLNLFRLQKPQKEGFVIICQDKDGNLINEKTKVISLN